MPFHYESDLSNLTLLHEHDAVFLILLISSLKLLNVLKNISRCRKVLYTNDTFNHFNPARLVLKVYLKMAIDGQFWCIWYGIYMGYLIYLRHNILLNMKTTYTMKMNPFSRGIIVLDVIKLPDISDKHFPFY